MDVTKKYKIAYKGLGEGDHTFDFRVDDKFFQAFENSGISSGDADITVGLRKSGNTVKLKFDISGTVTTECDRCLDDCELPINYTGELTVKFTEEDMEEGERYDGEILWMNPSEGEINIAQYIYESIILSLPFQRVHRDTADGRPGCNPDMLERFSIVTEEEFDDLTREEEAPVGLDDSNLEKLRKLKENM